MTVDSYASLCSSRRSCYWRAYEGAGVHNPIWTSSSNWTIFSGRVPVSQCISDKQPLSETLRAEHG